ncbi:DUF6602 domain-containing protein [Candidatus Poriferisodalis sp.]|uniref:DUF6602 domain-containing protein n=1 Tax=Candidatus Poriferisodalis sp. TaxID=3101277 RepID=UPI003B01AE97
MSAANGPETLIEALRAHADATLAELRKSGISAHSGIKGAAREEAIKAFFRCFLPGSYAIGHGEVFAEGHERSRQIDVIIHDELFSPVFRVGDGSILVPCEAVYGVAEVKTQLDGRGLEVALENIASVKRLPRAPSTPEDVLPNSAMRLTGSGGITIDTPDKPQNPYLGVIVALRSLPPERVIQGLEERTHNADNGPALLPDLIACLEGGWLITRYNKSETGGSNVGRATLGDSYDGFRRFEVGEYVLSSMHLGLNILLSDIRLKNRDLSQNWLEEMLWIERKTQLDRLHAVRDVFGVHWEDMEQEAQQHGDVDALDRLKRLRQNPPV